MWFVGIMLRKYAFPSVFGLCGVTLLLTLGLWQINRLEWKTNILDQIDQKINSSPTQLPASLSRGSDQYLSVSVTGQFKDSEIHVLSSVKFVGPGFRIIAPLELPNRRVILVDRGFVPQSDKNQERYRGPIQITGNLLWPDETDHYTPSPDIKTNIWFSRNLKEMAKFLGSEEVLLVAKVSSPNFDSLKPQPIGLNIPNNHMIYALTWFSLALVWLGMTIYMLWRINKQQL